MMTSTRPMMAAQLDTRPTILVVEDEWIIRMLIVDALRDEGMCVIEAASGAEAIEFIQSGATLDLIFTDVRMPGPVDGLALLAFAQQAAPGVPVIMSSGHLAEAIATNAGAVAFLGKPYRVAEAIDAISAGLVRH